MKELTKKISIDYFIDDEVGTVDIFIRPEDEEIVAKILKLEKGNSGE